MLSTQSDVCVKRLENIENDIACNDEVLSSAASIKSFDSSNSVRTTRDSILGLYKNTPYAMNLWCTSESSFTTAHEAQDSHAKVSEIVDECLGKQSFLPDHKRLERDVVETSGLDGDGGQCFIPLPNSSLQLAASNPRKMSN